MKDKVQLFAELDLTKKPTEVRVGRIEDPWTDLGYWLEILAFMGWQAGQYRELTKEQILDYIQEYLKKAITDYRPEQ